MRSTSLRRSLVLGLTMVLGLGTTALVLAPPAAAAGTTLNVTTTADIATTAGACGNSSITTAPSPLSLREATCLANNLGGTAAINVPSGHYTLSSGELVLGKFSGQNVSIVGAGSATTIIDGNNASRVLELDPNLVGGVSVSISGVTITKGRDTSFGGAGILAGTNSAAVDSLSIDRSTISSNAAPGSGMAGGGVQMAGGRLTITNSTLAGNSAGERGSGVYYSGGSSAGDSASITGSTFSGNSVSNSTGTGQYGGALALQQGSASNGGASYTVTGSTFTGNTVVANAGFAVGAAIFQDAGTLTATGNTFTGNSVSGATPSGAAAYSRGSATATLHHNRITGNTGPQTVASDAGSTVVDASSNWWGCNGGAGTAGCDTKSGAVSAAPWLKLTATASPAHVLGPNGTATITAALTTDSLGATVSGSNLGAFDSLPVTFSDPPGDATVGAPSATFSSGQASVGYNSHTTLGPDNVGVTLDNATVTAALEVDQPPAITSANSATFDIGSAGSFTVTSSGYPNAALSESGTLPTGLTFADNGNGTATISGTPTGGGGSFPLTITANNGYSPSATQTLTLSVGQPPSLTSPSTATFTVGTPGSFPITTSGVPAISSITEAGSLPPGLTFVDNGNGTATIAGTPTGTGGTYPVVLTATNGAAPNATQALTIQVNQPPAVTANPSDQTVQSGTSVSFLVSASGVPTPTVQWQRSTDGGASFVNIAGATSTTYTFTAAQGDDGNQYRAVFSNAAGSATSTAATLAVGTAPAFTSASTTRFVVGQPGSFAIATTGAPNATLSRTGTQFPAWLTLTDNGDGTGTLTGTPPSGSAGAYVFTLEAANGFSPVASQTFTLEVDDSPVITSADHETFTVGTAGSFPITATVGYPATTTFSKTGSLPSGVTFVDNGNGTASLAGTPVAGTGGSYPITITANAVGGLAAPATQSFTLTVQAPPSITSADHAAFDAGSAGTFTVRTAAGTPAASTLSMGGGLPSGVSFTDNGDGTATIAGTPALGSGGSYSISLTASNGIAPDDTQAFTLTVRQPPTITSLDHHTFRRDAAGAFLVSTLYAVPDAVTLTETGQLPPGMTFVDQADGTALIGGTPTADGVYDLTITASNGTAPDDVQHLRLTVEAPASFTSADQAWFRAGQPGSFTVTTSAGQPTATALTKTGALPAGVTFTDNGDGTATIAGTPQAGSGGVYGLVLTADNGVGPAPKQPLTLTVREPASITSADHVTWLRGQPSSFTVTTRGGEPAAVTLTSTGGLPAGVSFTDNGDGTATLAGVPGAGGVDRFDITASNGVLPDQVQAFTLTVEAPAAFTSTRHASFRTGQPGSFTVTTSPGQPAATALTKTGALPAGVAFTDNGDGTATIAGTPAAGAGGLYDLVLTADNGVAGSPTQAFTLTVEQVPAFTSPDHEAMTVGVADTFTVRGTGFPEPSLSVTGSAPDGVAVVDNHDGTLTVSGTPKPGSAGDHVLHVVADNGVGTPVEQDLTLTVGKVAQAISLGSPAPASGTVGGSYRPDVAADSGLPVEVSIAPDTTGAACALRSGVVGFDHPGSCVVAFTQAGDDTYAAASTVRVTIPVGSTPTSTTLSVPAGELVFGEAVRATARINGGGQGPAGAVQFAVDGREVGAPVPVVDGVATSPDLATTGEGSQPGAHTVTGTFVPGDATTWAGSTGASTYTVGQAATTTAVQVGPHEIAATVVPVAPGAGTPTGEVTFSVDGQQVGTATLVDGVARLDHVVPAGSERAVAAVYTGDRDFTGSSASTTRQDPTITAVVRAAHGLSHAGWYRSVVTVTFECAEVGSPLTAPCPDPVRLRRPAAGQSVTRTITAADGGVATAVVSGLDIDRRAPRLRIAGVRDGGLYAAGRQPQARCVALDPLSGVASCRLARHRDGDTVRLVARAKDKAGNLRVVRASYRLRRR